MANDKTLVVEHLLVVRHLGLARGLQAEVLGELLVNLVRERRVAGTRHLRFFVEEMEDAILAFNHLDHVLVVNVLDLLELDRLLHIPGNTTAGADELSEHMQ